MHNFETGVDPGKNSPPQKALPEKKKEIVK
jgi:hypothetical protein